MTSMVYLLYCDYYIFRHFSFSVTIFSWCKNLNESLKIFGSDTHRYSSRSSTPHHTDWHGFRCWRSPTPLPRFPHLNREESDCIKRVIIERVSEATPKHVIFFAVMVLSQSNMPNQFLICCAVRITHSYLHHAPTSSTCKYHLNLTLCFIWRIKV